LERASPFGQLLRRYRLAAGLSQEALAERARISAQGVSALERGARQTPQRETLILLANALALSTDERAHLEASAARASRPRGAATGAGAAYGATQLPSTLTSFHGRENDVAALSEAIGHERLVTLTGTGGVGKTRLAIETARRISGHFADGIRYVELSAIGAGSLVVHRTAEAIGAPLESPVLAAAVVAALRSRHTLLVFDTCEHVLADVTALIASILDQTEHVHVLATSRQALSIRGEVVRHVPSLGEQSAVALFVARARAAHSAFELTAANESSVGEICRRLDGIPLALELVAPRVTILSPREIAELLRERLPLLGAPAGAALSRQQTMRSVLDWSFELLDERERTLFRRLGAFTDGWSFERCRAVCSDALLSQFDVLEALTALVAKSLVAVASTEDGQRFRLLESTRAYALERLDASGEMEPTMQRVAAALSTEVHRLRHLWDTMENGAWQSALGLEREAIRSVMGWWMSSDVSREPGVALLVDIADPGLVFESREIRQWYDYAADCMDRLFDEHLRATLARCIAQMAALDRKAVETVCAFAETAVRAARVTGDSALTGEALRVLGTALREADRLLESEQAFAEGWALTEVHCSLAAKAALLSDWAMRDLRDGALDRARERLHQCLRIARPGSIIRANTLATLGELAFSAGDIRAARAFSSQANGELRAMNLRVYLGVGCSNAAAYAMADDDLSAARTAIEEALELLQETGVGYYVTVALEHCAVMAALEGDDERACSILAYTQRAIERAGRTREQTERIGYDRAIQLLEERLGRDQLAHRFAQDALTDERLALEHARAYLSGTVTFTHRQPEMEQR
jgi:predicted ATPase/transcriptional regulator with XRE-family HTH domain